MTSHLQPLLCNVKVPLGFQHCLVLLPRFLLQPPKLSLPMEIKGRRLEEGWETEQFHFEAALKDSCLGPTPSNYLQNTRAMAGCHPPYLRALQLLAAFGSLLADVLHQPRPQAARQRQRRLVRPAPVGAGAVGGDGGGDVVAVPARGGQVESR